MTGHFRLARMRRLVLPALALFAAGGCSSAGSGNTNYSQFYEIVKQGIAGTMGNIRVTRDQAAAIPYASLGFSLDGGNQSILVLATDTNGELLWTSPSKIVIVTRDGRIVRTLGLGRDLSGVTTPTGPPPPPAAAIREPFTSTRQEDFPEMGYYGLTLTCSARLVGRQKIRILGQDIATSRVDESCRSRNPEWSFTNSFWIDPDNGLVWRSRQHVHPKGATIDLEIFRPPG